MNGDRSEPGSGSGRLIGVMHAMCYFNTLKCVVYFNASHVYAVGCGTHEFRCCPTLGVDLR